MGKLKFLFFAATSLAAVAFSQTQVLASTTDDNFQATSDGEISIANKALHSGQDQPANRDYHMVLGAFETAADDGYKFSGCGSAI